MHQKLLGLDPAWTETCFLEQQLILITHIWNSEQDRRALWWNWVRQFALDNSNLSTCAVRTNQFHFTWCPWCNSVRQAPHLFVRCFSGAKKLTFEAWAWCSSVPTKVNLFPWGWSYAAVLVVLQLGTWGKMTGYVRAFPDALGQCWFLGGKSIGIKGQNEVEQKLHKLRTSNMSLI